MKKLKMYGGSAMKSMSAGKMRVAPKTIKKTRPSMARTVAKFGVAPIGIKMTDRIAPKFRKTR